MGSKALLRLLLAVVAIISSGVLSQREAATSLPTKVLQEDTTQMCPDSTGVQEDILKEVRHLLAGSMNCTAQETRVGSCNCQCGREGGRWKRMAFLNMSDSTSTCPRLSSWRELTTPVRACGRSAAVGCSSAFFPSNGQRYSRICGRITGYQINTPDGFADRVQNPTIDDDYLDGVSITRGFPRQHVWSFAASFSDRPENICPCVATSTSVTPNFVGENYYCESSRDSDGHIWDGKGCSQSRACECTHNNPPWFCQELGEATDDVIEVRICGNQGHSDEQTPVQLVEIHVQ